jgi:hypothetical protein
MNEDVFRTWERSEKSQVTGKTYEQTTYTIWQCSDTHTFKVKQKTNAFGCTGLAYLFLSVY